MMAIYEIHVGEKSYYVSGLDLAGRYADKDTIGGFIAPLTEVSKVRPIKVFDNDRELSEVIRRDKIDIIKSKLTEGELKFIGLV